MTFFSPSRRTLGAVSVASLLTSWASEGRALSSEPAALGRVVVAVGGRGSLYHLPLMLADQLGFFRAEGLEVWVQDHAAGALALRAMQDGAADVCCGAFEHVLRQQTRGQNYRAVVLQGRAPQLALGVSLRALPAFENLLDLIGRRVGVSSETSSTHLAARLMLERAGVSAERVNFVAVGSGVAAVNALRTGQVHALCHTDPIMTWLENKADLRIVDDRRSLKTTQELFGGAMPASCLFAPQTFVQKFPAQAQALVNGIVHALKWLQTAEPADIVKTVPSAYLLREQGTYVTAFNRVRETYSPHGVMPEEGPKVAWRALVRAQPALAKARIDLDRSYTNEFVRKARIKFNV